MRKATFTRSGLGSKKARVSEPGIPTAGTSSSAISFQASADRRRAYPEVNGLSIEELAAAEVARDNPALDFSDISPPTTPLHQPHLHADYYDDYRHWFEPSNEAEGELLTIDELEAGQALQVEDEDAPNKRYQSSVRYPFPMVHND